MAEEALRVIVLEGLQTTRTPERETQISHELKFLSSRRIKNSSLYIGLYLHFVNTKDKRIYSRPSVLPGSAQAHLLSRKLFRSL